MTAHGEALRTESNDDPLVEGIKQDYTQLQLPPPERAMLDYAVKLTVAPSSVGEEDIRNLARAGFRRPRYFGYRLRDLPLQFQRSDGRRDGNLRSRFSCRLSGVV